MKNLSFTCDKCGKIFANTEEMLTIGTKDNSLFVRNNIEMKRLFEMDNHSDIHFCSKGCFVTYFFHSITEL